MYEDRSIIVEFEEFLIGNRARLGTEFKGYTLQKRESINELLRYVFTNILRWTPEMVKTYINKRTTSQLKLNAVLKYIEFPPELDREKDLFYLAKILYPEEIKYTHKDIVLHTYSAVLNGSRSKFPADFFSDADGHLNFSICLNYYLSSGRDTQIIFMNMAEAYDFFANDDKVNPILMKAKLYTPCYNLYDNALEMFHDALSTSQKDEFLYMKHKFQKEFNKAQRKIRRKEVQN